VTTLKNPQNDQMYEHSSTKKKDVVTKPLASLAKGQWGTCPLDFQQFNL